MVFTVLVVNISIPESFSIKDKRRVIKSLIERVKNKFNVSIAEIEKNDMRKESVIACAHISNNKVFSETYLKKVFLFIERHASDFVILDFRVSFL